MFKYLLILFSIQAMAEDIKINSEDSIAINSTSGNVEMKTYVLKSENNLKIYKNYFKLSGHYNYQESKKIRNGESWEAEIRYERDIFRKLRFYLGEKIEANRYAGIRRRYNYDIGNKYIFSKNDNKHLFVEIGYRYTVEKNKKKLKDSKARCYAEIYQELSKLISSKLWAEYLYNFTRPEDFLINIEPSLTVIISSILSLKSSYLWKYDNYPVKGNGRHDYQYLLSLIAKF